MKNLISGFDPLRVMAIGYPNPVDAIKITDVELASEDGEKYNIITENLRDAGDVSF